MSDKTKIIEKIRSLLKKTVENGCTEAEATAAYALASRLMEAHNISTETINSVKDKGQYGPRFSDAFCSGDRNHVWHACNYLFGWVADFWNVKAVTVGRNLVYFGTENETEAAMLMTHAIKTSIDTAWTRFRVSRIDLDGRTAKGDFQKGMVRVIARRLHEIIEDRTAARATTTGRELVVIAKDEALQQALTEHFGKLKKGKNKKRTYRNEDAYRAGSVAGETADIGIKSLT